MIAASRCPDGQYMCGIYETELDASDSAPVSVGEQYAPSKIGRPTQPANFPNYALALYRKRRVFRDLRRFVDSLIEKAKDIGFPAVAVEQLCIHGIGHQHIRPDTYSDFIVAFAVKAQSIRLSQTKYFSVDLN